MGTSVIDDLESDQCAVRSANDYQIAVSTELPTHGPRDPRRRRPDRRRRSGRAVGRAAAGAAAEGRRAASRSRSRCSRRRARPARTCCRARVLDPSALGELVPDFEAQGRAARRPRCTTIDVYFLTRGGKRRSFRSRRRRSRTTATTSSRSTGSCKWLGGAGRGRGHRRLHRVSPATERALRRRSRRRRAHRRSWDRQARRAEADLRAGRRHPREGHDPRRRRARQPDQGARAAAAARRGTSAAALRDRHQGAVGGAARPDASRAPSSTRWAIRCGWRSSAAGSSTRCRTA